MELISLTWWMWMVLGLILLACELLTPGGFYILFFGVGAIVVGLLKLVGLTGMSLAIEGLIFVVVSVACLALFRKRVLSMFQKPPVNDRIDEIADETAVALDDIPARGLGKVELRGTSWNAENVGDAAISKSARCRIDKVDGLTLHVRNL
jgi:hypothetical protein